MKTPKVTDSTEQVFLPQKVKQRHGLLLSSSVASLAFGLLIPHFFLPALLFSLTCLGLLFLFTRKPSLFKASSSRRLQDLKDNMYDCDQKINRLEKLLDKKEYIQYGILAYQILSQLTTIQTESESLKSFMDATIYKGISQRVGQEQSKIKASLDLLDISRITGSTDTVLQEILKYAPEITKIYQSIQSDHLEILSKLKEAENKTELLAIHDINMNRFRDILLGYLKIKEAPKNYNRAEDRLIKAKAAMEQFDTDLDDTLKKLNEAELGDFEISLRMMEKKSYGQE